MAIYDKADIWTAGSENHFTFHYEEGIIRWFHEVVDLIQICDSCLADVHKALTSCARCIANYLDRFYARHPYCMLIVWTK